MTLTIKCRIGTHLKAKDIGEVTCIIAYTKRIRLAKKYGGKLTPKHMFRKQFHKNALHSFSRAMFHQKNMKKE